MANSLRQRLSGLILSAIDLKFLTDQGGRRVPWPDELIEDYLNIFQNLVELATSIDTGLGFNLSTKASDYTTTDQDGVILINGASNQVIISLDATPKDAQEHAFKCIDDTNACYVSPNGNELDQATADFQLFQDESINVKADSDKNWWII